MYSTFIFCVTPIVDVLYTAYGYLAKCCPPSRLSVNQQKALAQTAQEQLLVDERVPHEVAMKVNQFIEELGLEGINSDTLILIAQPLAIGQFNSPAAASHRYSKMGAPPTSVMYLDGSMIEKLRNQPLTPEDEFVIAHEIGHIQAQDTMLGECEKGRIVGPIRLIAYAVSFVALHALSFGVWPSHFLACTVAKIAGIYPDQVISQRQEKNADLFAARLNARIAGGGIDLLEAYKRKQQECTSGCFGHMANFHWVEAHPSPEERIKEITPFASHV